MIYNLHDTIKEHGNRILLCGLWETIYWIDNCLIPNHLLSIMHIKKNLQTIYFFLQTISLHHTQKMWNVRQIFTKNELYDEQMLKDKKNGEYKTLWNDVGASTELCL